MGCFADWVPDMIRWFYQMVVYLLAPVVCSVLVARGFRDRSYWANFRQRFGFGEYGSGGAIWVHAVSVGEVQAAAALVSALRLRYPTIPLTLTTVTPTGATRARALFPQGVDVRFIPWDLPGSVRRYFDRVRPRIAIILETELWPNLYHECGLRKVPLVLASARISPRSLPRYRRLASLFSETLSHGIVIAAQSTGDAERFRSIGANPAKTHVIGNIKFDIDLPADIFEQGAILRAQYGVDKNFMWVAGSTHEGEEDIVLAAQMSLQQSGVRSLLVIAPRHPTHFAHTLASLKAANLAFVRRSSGEIANAQTQVLLLDTLGDLLAFYAAADVAFVGGSLVPIGGHNLLEPSSLGRPSLTGPFVFNAQEIAEKLISTGAVEQVIDAPSMSAALQRLVSDPLECVRRGTLAQALVESNRGTLQRLLALIAPVIAAWSSPSIKR
ncbi:MAG: 3-deoxy-D-manno-octulosonic acid transferase [Gammaproteobacteria bacterium]|nr:3-deoxy-D-manno-octulosonic acid transferase [Gammaproteobacteria bacterium]